LTTKSIYDLVVCVGEGLFMEKHGSTAGVLYYAMSFVAFMLSGIFLRLSFTSVSDVYPLIAVCLLFLSMLLFGIGISEKKRLMIEKGGGKQDTQRTSAKHPDAGVISDK
jgi:hydrogenase/urease accessory protein HupE